MDRLTAKKDRGDRALTVKTIIGLIVTFGFQLLPAPEPITRAGMAAIGMFLGIVWFIATVDKVWPTFVVMILFSFYAFDIYPDSTADSPVYETVLQSFGNWITFFIVALMLMCHAVSESGLLQRMTVWFVTSRVARRGPWSLTLMFLLATLIVGCVMDCTPATVIMIMIAHEIFEALGFKPGDSWPKALICMIPMVVTVAFGMTPIGHNLAVGIMGIASEASETPVNMVQYMVIGVPTGLVILTCMCLYFRFAVRPDVTPFANVDYSALLSLKSGAMGKREKFVAAVSLLVLLFWLMPGVLAIAAPQSQLLQFVNNMSMLWPVLVADALFAMVRIDGRPVLDIKDALSRISWIPAFMFAGIIMVANALRQDSVGVIDWVTEQIVPLIGGATPIVIIMVLAVVTVVCTNFLNNNAVGYLFITASAPIAASLGINPAVVAVVVALGANCAYTTPAASVVATFSCTDEYCDAGYVFRHGCVMLLFSLAALSLLAYPLGKLI